MTTAMAELLKKAFSAGVAAGIEIYGGPYDQANSAEIRAAFDRWVQVDQEVPAP